MFNNPLKLCIDIVVYIAVTEKPTVTLVSGQSLQQLKAVPAGVSHAQLTAIMAQQQMQPPQMTNWKTPALSATVLSTPASLPIKSEVKSEVKLETALPTASPAVIIQPSNPEASKKVC